MDERDHNFVRRLPLLPPYLGLRSEDRPGLPLHLCHQHRAQHHQVQ